MEPIDTPGYYVTLSIRMEGTQTSNQSGPLDHSKVAETTTIFWGPDNYEG